MGMDYKLEEMWKETAFFSFTAGCHTGIFLMKLRNNTKYSVMVRSASTEIRFGNFHKTICSGYHCNRLYETTGIHLYNF
jgi:hypothetical protein